MNLEFELEVTTSEVVVKDAYENKEICTVPVTIEFYGGYTPRQFYDSPPEPAEWVLKDWDLPEWLMPFTEDFTQAVDEIIAEWE